MLSKAAFPYEGPNGASQDTVGVGLKKMSRNRRWSGFGPAFRAFAGFFYLLLQRPAFAILVGTKQLAKFALIAGYLVTWGISYHNLGAPCRCEVRFTACRARATVFAATAAVSSQPASRRTVCSKTCSRGPLRHRRRTRRTRRHRIRRTTSCINCSTPRYISRICPSTRRTSSSYNPCTCQRRIHTPRHRRRGTYTPRQD